MRARSQHNFRQRRIVRTAVVALVVVLVGMLLPRLASAVAAMVVYPIHVTNVWLNESSSLVPSFFRDRVSLVAEIEDLQHQLETAKRTDITQRRLFEENNRLRQLLGAEGNSRVLASVIARPNELPYDLLQIDRGSNSGIAVGAPVFIGSDIVIGLVVHTAPTYSFVELVTTPGFKATAFISGPNIVAPIQGFGGGVARVRVPQGIPLAVGNLVYLPSVEPGVYGRISHVENQPTQPEQYGYISPEIAIGSLFEVSVGEVSQISQSPEVIDVRILEQMKKELLVPGVSVGTLSSTTASSTATTTPEVEVPE